MQIVFMGTPDFSVPSLRALVDAGHEIVCAYTQPPRPAGRGKRDRPGAVHQAADALGIEIRHPTSLKSDAAQADFADLRPDIAVVVAYGLLLPQAMLDVPARGCLNIHASLLPRWRGAAPIHRSILAGDDETGVCTMRMEAGLDTGPVLLRDTTPIGDTETTGDLHDRLATMGGRLVVQTLAAFDKLTPEPQPEHGVTYATKIDKAEARIDWRQSSDTIDRQIRGLSPFPGAWCEIGGERVKLLRSRVVEGGGAPGAVLNGFTIACGTGAVEVLELQRAGKRAQSAEDVLHGMALPEMLD